MPFEGLVGQQLCRRGGGEGEVNKERDRPREYFREALAYIKNGKAHATLLGMGCAFCIANCKYERYTIRGGDETLGGAPQARLPGRRSVRGAGGGEQGLTNRNAVTNGNAGIKKLEGRSSDRPAAGVRVTHAERVLSIYYR